MLPHLRRLIAFLETRIVEPAPDVSRPHFLNEAVDKFPQTLESALRKEVMHLYENAVELILHGLNLHRDEVYATNDIAETVRRSRNVIELDIDESYERRVKTLYAAIVDFTTRAGSKRLAPDITDRIYALRDVASDIVQVVKSVKHLRKNVNRYTTRPQGTATELYDGLRTEIARIVIAIRDLGAADPDERSSLWLDQEAAQVEQDARNTTRRIDALIRARELSPFAATSFLNDSGYAYSAMRELIDVARSYYIERDEAVAEVERILSLDEDEIGESLGRSSRRPRTPAEPRNTSVMERR